MGRHRGAGFGFGLGDVGQVSERSVPLRRPPVLSSPLSVRGSRSPFCSRSRSRQHKMLLAVRSRSLARSLTCRLLGPMLPRRPFGLLPLLAAAALLLLLQPHAASAQLPPPAPANSPAAAVAASSDWQTGKLGQLGYGSVSARCVHAGQGRLASLVCSSNPPLSPPSHRATTRTRAPAPTAACRRPPGPTAPSPPSTPWPRPLPAACSRAAASASVGRGSGHAVAVLVSEQQHTAPLLLPAASPQRSSAPMPWPAPAAAAPPASWPWWQTTAWAVAPALSTWRRLPMLSWSPARWGRSTGASAG